MTVEPDVGEFIYFVVDTGEAGDYFCDTTDLHMTSSHDTVRLTVPSPFFMTRS